MKRPLPADAFLLEDTYAKTRLPVDFASTLIPDAYVSPEFHALEQERVFAKSWVPVCVPDEVREPGQFLVVEVAGRSIIVTRNQAGELRAHHNVCRHRGARLCEGTGKVKRFFSCPYHAWAYDLDGTCLGTPLFTPESEVPIMPKATSIQLLFRLPMKKDSLSELREVYQATPSKRRKYPSTKENKVIGVIILEF